MVLLYFQVDSGLGEEVVILKVHGLPGNRLVFASTGPVNRDYDDARRFSDAAVNGIKRSAGGSFFFPLPLCFILVIYLQGHISIPLMASAFLSLKFFSLCPTKEGMQGKM